LFDYEQYRREHYAEGWFDYFDGLGVTTKTAEECVSQIEEALKNRCQMPTIYTRRVEQWFPYRDQNNCQRVFEAIAELEKRKVLYICEA
jgi:CDP-glycerol glycerophosphotransferase (TagB/SpsB family)